MTTALKRAIGARLRAARIARNLSQNALAEKIDRTEDTVSNIERGLTGPTIATLERLGRALDIPVSVFLEDDDRPTVNKKRVEYELQIRDLLKRLSMHELKIARKQILALLDNDN
jgi:transcriptional regulator with XRE-family HTH domain